MSGVSRTLALTQRLPRLPDLRRLRHYLIVGSVLVAVAAAGYLFWLRDSSLVAIERVTVTGAEGEPAVETALSAAAEEMTTLHVDEDALRAAVADQPAVLALATSTDFPHGLSIEVDVRRPVGFVEGGAILAGDGVVLETGAERPDGLPVIEAEEAVPGEGRAEGAALALARVLEGAPDVLLAEASAAEMTSDRGPVVEVGPGIELRFGDPSGSAEKWAAAAAVLADRELDSAAYIDLSVPSRPTVG